MKKIKRLVEEMSEEICGAKKYAEKYLESKVKGDTMWANRYSEMAEDELRHATYLHEKCVAEIEQLKNVLTVPVDMQEKWDKAHAKYIERVTTVKQLLAM